VAFGVANADSFTYYVTQSGNDNWNGTSKATAFRNIQKAIDMCDSDGNLDTIKVYRGTYHENLVFDDVNTTAHNNKHILLLGMEWSGHHDHGRGKPHG